MATPKHPAKPGNNWTSKELDVYKIQVNTVDTKTFFGISKLPAPAVDPLILENVDLPHSSVVKPPLDVRNFFIYLHDTTDKDQPTYVDDFTYHLLGSVLEFDLPDGRVCTRETFPFIMSGQRVIAIANVSVRDANYQLVLVQKDEVSVPLSMSCIAEYVCR